MMLARAFGSDIPICMMREEGITQITLPDGDV